MKEITEDEVLRFTRGIPVPKKGAWDVALLRRVDQGEMVSFRGRLWRVETVSVGEFCGACIHQVRLTPAPIPGEDGPQGSAGHGGL